MTRYGLAFLVLLWLFFGFGSLPKPDELTIKALDIGQGDAIYLRLPSGEDVLVDAGVDNRVLGELGLAMPFGDRTIETVILSHNHADHIGGLDTILDSYTVKKILISGAIHTTDQYLRLLEKIKQKQVTTEVVRAGDSFSLGETQFTVLHPMNIAIGSLPEDQHDATIVVKASFRKFCVLLTGDLDATHESQIIQFAHEQQISLRCDLLKVSHHGSRTSSTQQFLEAVLPKVAMISVGENNRYGHPTQEALDRLTNIGAQILRTDQNGIITLRTNGETFWTKTER